MQQQLGERQKNRKIQKKELDRVGDRQRKLIGMTKKRSSKLGQRTNRNECLVSKTLHQWILKRWQD